MSSATRCERVSARGRKIGIGRVPWPTLPDATIPSSRCAPLLESVLDWEAFIGGTADEKLDELLRGHASTGRPLGTDAFVASLKRKKLCPKTRELDRYTGDLFGEGEPDRN